MYDKQDSSKKPIIFIDSGIGGLPYCQEFINENPHEAVCYIADNKNYPYGRRSKDELTAILISLTEKLIQKLNPKIIVLACNTATIASISSLRQSFPQIPFVGTVPAVKPAATACNNGKVGVLGTERTIEEIKNLNLADKTCEIFGIAAPELVDYIELRFDDSDENEKTETVKKYIKIFQDEKVDTLVLGCTHFLFLLEEFRREAAGCFEIFDSLEGITKRIEFLLDENNGVLRAANNVGKHGSYDEPMLVLTEETASPLWQTRARKTGFKLTLLDEL